MKDTDRYPNAESYDRLRRSARDLIDHGVSPPHCGGNLSVDALQLLYEQASRAETAGDALKLLHELQTYQVELDLLYEQLQANEHEISEELAHYRSLYEQAPVAYLIVANDGEIIEGNQAASVLFGQSTTDLAGNALSSVLAPGEEVTVNTLLRNSGNEEPASASFELPDRRRVKIIARSAAARDSILMILIEATANAATS
ncbi:PAS domain S-box protein [Marinobacter guineae]|uniref:PAS domain S-box protein n=1 Tax=Marinobacter guineae TaxID=432303 RepID=A0A2G1VDX6_9GAMM|nr:PAS domain S-box protein [Marinobacter guineae]PHQ24965.1 PAS domain S-box protein [Marinobacter guineae]